MRKSLRFAATAFSLAACLLLIALWVSSYTTRDSVFWPWIDRGIKVSSLKGHVVVWVVGKEPEGRWETQPRSSTVRSKDVLRRCSITTFSDFTLHPILAVFALMCRIGF